MKKPKKPQKPKKKADPIKEFVNFNKQAFQFKDEIIFLDEEEKFDFAKEILQKLYDENAPESEFYDINQEEDIWRFWEDDCFWPVFTDYVDEDIFESIKEACPTNAHDITLHFSTDIDGYPDVGYVSYTIKKSQSEIDEEQKAIDNRFKKYEEELALYDQEMKKYTEWKKQEKLNKLKKEIEKLENDNG